jgi:hypothetical protein
MTIQTNLKSGRRNHHGAASGLKARTGVRGGSDCRVKVKFVTLYGAD